MLVGAGVGSGPAGIVTEVLAAAPAWILNGAEIRDFWERCRLS